MERTGYVRSIQGGGSGSGFRTPNTLKFDEPRLYRALVKTITKRSSEAASKCRGKSNKQRMNNWKSSLLRRMFLIDSIRPIPKKSKPAMSPVTFGTCPQISSPKSSFQSSTTVNQVLVPAGNKSDGNERELETTIARHTPIVLHQFVPKMPKTIEELVHYWRFGCPASLGFPVKKFEDPKFRRENISNYTDAIWRKGHRQLFARYKKLIELVRYSVNPPIHYISDDMNEEEMWQNGIENFNSEWKDVALTKVLSFTTASKSSVRGGHQTNERFVCLSAEEIVRFHEITDPSSYKSQSIRVQTAKITLRPEDLSGLRGSNWINDEIINSFAALLNLRNRDFFNSLRSKASNDFYRKKCFSGRKVANGPCRPRTFMFNSHFFSRLALSKFGYDYEGVKAWPKRSGISINELDLVLFPVNISNKHWVLAAVDIKSRKMLYFDSKNGEDSMNVLQTLKLWLIDETKDKYSIEEADFMGIESWPCIFNPPYMALQTDTGSCGIFAMYTADYLELGKKIDFSQSQIPVLRQRMALFLYRNRIANHPLIRREEHDNVV